jgi:hypothetical protein
MCLCVLPSAVACCAMSLSQSELMSAGARLGMPATEEAALLSSVLHAHRCVFWQCIECRGEGFCFVWVWTLQGKWVGGGIGGALIDSWHALTVQRLEWCRYACRQQS